MRPCRLKPLAVNIYTLVLIMDFTDPVSLLLADSFHTWWQEAFPVRLGKPSR